MLKQITVKIYNRRFEIFRFGLVGVIATLIHYGVYYSLLKYRVSTNIAYTFGYGISLILNLYLSLKFTFKTQGSVKKSFGFIGSHGINYLLHICFLNLYIYMGIDQKIAPLFVYLCVVPINFYLVQKVLKSNKL